MAETQTTTSRRGMLAVLAAAPVAIGITAPAVASVNRSNWDKAMAAHQAAVAACEAYDRDFYLPADAEIDRRAPRPELSFSVAARNGAVAKYSWYPGEARKWDAAGPPLREAAARVEAAWIEHQRVRAEVGMPAIEEREEELSEARYQAWRTLIHTPAPDLAAVLWKLDDLYGADRRAAGEDHTDAWHHKITDQLRADVARLGGLN